jgi:hypothetical protein
MDSIAGCSLLSFLDCYSGYHQIPLKVEDQIKTFFIAPFGAFCYTTMPFGLKSAGATYQQGIQQCLHSQIRLNAEAYVDDVVVKAREEEGLISDLAETFDNMRKFKTKLSPEKCTFGVPSGKLLGYMVSHRSIDSNPENVSAIIKMKPPESVHDVQKLTGCIAALSRFISCLGVRGLPFFKLLKKYDKFQWTQDAQEAFEDLKKYLTTPPTPVALEPHKNLHLYIFATSFISDMLSDSITRYFHIMKLAYALLIMSHKLSHYFQVHQIKVHTSSTLGKILNNREATGKIAKWAIELSMNEIIYKPMTTIKAQALSNFIAEWTETQAPPKERELEYLTINFDRSLQLQGAGAGILVTSPKGESFKYVLQMHFPASNNAAEYEALLHGL